MITRSRIYRFVAMALCCLPGLAGADGERTPAAAVPDRWEDSISPALQAEYLATLREAVCQPIAQPSQFLIDRQNALWGNAFTMLRDSELTDFQIELTLFNNPTPLHFSVYRAQTPEEPDTPYGAREFEPIYIGPPIDASPIGNPGDELPAYYSAQLPKRCGGVAFGALCSVDAECTPEKCLTVPIHLLADYDYILAVAWGSEFVELHNNQENTTFPKSLVGNDGKTLGVAVTNNPTLPLDPGANLSSTVFNFYALSMNLCLEPQPGACCNGTGCNEIKPSDCFDQGGTFTRERLTCAELVIDEQMSCPLPTWACCLPDDGCLKLNKFYCDTLGGEWHRNILCTDLPDPCAAKGRCCLAGGTCQIVTENECNLKDGLYGGDDTACGTFCTTGACCLSGTTCTNLSIGDCNVNGGTWRGHGTRCAGNGTTCAPRGACCTGTTCQDADDDMTEVGCLAISGQYRGNWTTCETLDVPCGKGACCTPAFGCFPNLTQSQCQNAPLFGTFLGGGVGCDDVASQCPGTCCALGNCLDPVSAADCAEYPSAIFVGYGQDCPSNGSDPDPCEGLGTPEACCFPDGVCAEVASAADCTDLSGVPQGVASCDSVSCVAPPALGACCLAGGSCAQLTEAECANHSGTYHGDGTQCSLSTCGVCCRGDGVCDDLQGQTSCINATGLCMTGDHDGEACTSPWDCAGLCDDGVTPCVTDDDCTSPDICNGAGVCDLPGLFFPAEACTSGSFECPLVGACCVAGPQCIADITAFACTQMDGFFEGASTTCGPPDPCTPGACCHDDGTCTTVLPRQCSDAGGQPPAGGGDCSACPVAGACCHDDGTCTMVTENACTIAGGTWQTGLTCGVDDTCPSAGACCKDDESCAMLTENACDAAGGAWNGAISCTSSTDSRCQKMACCRNDGTCDESVGFQCAADQGDESFPGEDCTSGTFECPPVGACCVAEQPCIADVTEYACGEMGGSFEGEGATCGPPDPCVPSSCCHDDGTCTMEIQKTCTITGGTWQFGLTCGVDDTCPAAGGCCKDDETCAMLTENACDSAGGAWSDAFTCTSPLDSHCQKFACCRIDGSCDAAYRFQCAGPGEETFTGDCSQVSCTPKGACCAGGACDVVTEEDCIDDDGCYLGDATHCGGPTCGQTAGGFSILESDPASGSVDARTPAVDNPPLALTLELTLDVGVTSDVCLFSVSEVGGDGVPPDIAKAELVPDHPDHVRLTLSEPVEARAWLKITHPNSLDEVCVGVLPGDVNSDLVTDAADLGAMITCLNAPLRCGGVISGAGCTLATDCTAPDLCLPVSCDAMRCDLDRLGTCTGADLAMLINLLNGAGELDSWDGQTLPASPCP